MAKRILLGTRKGTVIVEQKDGHWTAKDIAHAGIPVCYVACDKRDGTLWASLDHGHWGPNYPVRKMAEKHGKMCSALNIQKALDT